MQILNLSSKGLISVKAGVMTSTSVMAAANPKPFNKDVEPYVFEALNSRGVVKAKCVSSSPRPLCTIVGLRRATTYLVRVRSCVSGDTEVKCSAYAETKVTTPR